MLNTIRMDLYRAFKSKCFSITILIAALLFIGGVATIKYQSTHPMDMPQAMIEDDTFKNVGIVVGAPISVEGELSIDMILAVLFQGGTSLVLSVIFCVTFVTTDYNSGFIKNIISRKNYRRQASISKAIVIAIYSFIEILISFFMVLLSTILLFGELKFDNFGMVLFYLGVQYLLQTALMIICMFVGTLVRSIGITMAFGICLSSGLFTIIPELIDRFKLPVTLCDYILSIFTRSLPVQYDNTIYMRAIIVSVISIGVFLIGSITVVKHQDIK